MYSKFVHTWENIKSKYSNNKFKISSPTWSKTFDLPDGSYEISDIEDYFLKMIKNTNQQQKLMKNLQL